MMNKICDDQGWSDNSKKILATNFLEEFGLTKSFEKFAKEVAESEGSSLKEIDNLVSFEQISEYQGWNDTSQFLILSKFIDEVGLKSKLKSYFEKVAELENIEY